MAIPGYYENFTTNIEHTEYYDYVSGMLGIVGDTHAEVVTTINKLKAEIEANRSPSILSGDGYIDFTKLREPTVQELLNKHIVLVDYGDSEIADTAGGFIDGAFHLFLHQAAVDYVKQMTIPIPQQLQAPVLYISSTTGVSLGAGMEVSGQVNSYTFVATFMTKWGETGPSNPVYVFTKDFESGDENLLYGGKWWVTLEVEPDSITSYAQSVRYYRLFNSTFRLVGKVDI